MLDENLKEVRVPRANLGPCPVCGRDIVENRKGFSCWSREDPGCGFVIWKSKAGKTLPIVVARELITRGRTEKAVTGFKGRSGRSFRARLALMQSEDGKWRVEFDEPWAREGAKPPEGEERPRLRPRKRRQWRLPKPLSALRRAGGRDRPVARGERGRVRRGGRAGGGTMPRRSAAPSAARNSEKRADRAVLDQHGVNLGDPGAAVMAPCHVEILAPDDLGQIRSQDEVGIGVLDGQVEVRHFSKLPWRWLLVGVTATSLAT